MEITFEGGRYGLSTPDPKEFADMLVAINVRRYNGESVPVLGVKVRRPHKSHKRHQFMKECPECHKFFRGNTGLQVHRNRAHLGRNYSTTAHLKRTTPMVDQLLASHG